MIDAIPSWPRKYRAAVVSTFHLTPSTLFSASPYTGEALANEPHIQRFICNFTSPNLPGPQWRECSGIIAGIRGRSGAIRMVDYHRLRPGYDEEVRRERGQTVVNWDDDTTWTDGSGWESGFMPPAVLVDEAATRDARSLVLRGFPASIDACLRAGDLGEVRPNGLHAAHAHCYEITSQARSGPDGRTRIYFEPGLRAGVQVGDQFAIRYPTSVFRFMKDDEGVIQRVAPSNRGSFGLTLAEKLS